MCMFFQTDITELYKKPTAYWWRCSPNSMCRRIILPTSAGQFWNFSPPLIKRGFRSQQHIGFIFRTCWKYMNVGDYTLTVLCYYFAVFFYVSWCWVTAGCRVWLQCSAAGQLWKLCLQTATDKPFIKSYIRHASKQPVWWCEGKGEWRCEQCRLQDLQSNTAIWLSQHITLKMIEKPVLQTQHTYFNYLNLTVRP